MRLDSEFIQLPLQFDVQRMVAEVRSFGASDWKAHPRGFPGNSALSLMSVNGDPLNDEVKGPMCPTPLLTRSPYLTQVLTSFRSPIGRTRLMQVAGQSEATAHFDSSYYWMERVRIHIPIITNARVRFYCANRSLHMAAGECWIFDTWETHRVDNGGDEPRIHLVVDTVGSDYFWDLVRRGDQPFGKRNQEARRLVSYDPSSNLSLDTETRNFPIVMSPVEQTRLCEWLINEVRNGGKGSSCDIDAVVAICADLQNDWRALWDQHGEAASGWDAFQTRLGAFKTAIRKYIGTCELCNGGDFVENILRAVGVPSLNPELAPIYAAAESALKRESPVTVVPSRGPAIEAPRPSSPVEPNSKDQDAMPTRGTSAITRPVIILAAPRSGSTLLFETLAQSPDLWTIQSESHSVFEQFPELQPAARGFDSNRLTAQDATPAIRRAIHDAFVTRLRNRNGEPAVDGSGSLRMLEKTPKNSLRVPFLDQLFPDARYVYLFREPQENLASIIEAWRSGGFVTYPQLPGWQGLPWSLLLVPGWQSLVGQPLEEIAAAQYSLAHQAILDDLSRLPSDRWMTVEYSRLIADPQQEVRRVCQFADLRWDTTLSSGKLPLSRHTLTPPSPDKWKMHEQAIARVMPKVEPIVRRVREVLSGPTPAGATSSEPAVSRAMPSVAAHAAPPSPRARDEGPQAPVRSVNTTSFAALLERLGISLAVSTYQAGKLMLLRARNGKLNAHFRTFSMPMGVAGDRRRLVVGSRTHILDYRNDANAAKKLASAVPCDACYLLRKSHVTGDIRIHDVALAGNDIWFVNTRFSCLCTLDQEHSFVPRWRPPFVSALVPEDRCHLNGLAIADNRPRFVTCHAATNEEAGWRADKAAGGCLIDVETNETVLRGLSMPHSPRCYAGHVWLLESGHGSLARVDVKTRRWDAVATLPGFTRGLDFYQHYAFVGLSRVRETAIFNGIPITERPDERHCGVWVIDLRTGNVEGFVRFEAGVHEIFAVQVLPGVHYPDLITEDETILSNSFTVPRECL